MRRGSESMATNKGMIQVSGTTYRIASVAEQHEVIRVRDDLRVGVFEHWPLLRIVTSEISPAELMDVAKVALRTGRLPWKPASASMTNGVVPYVRAGAQRLFAAFWRLVTRTVARAPSLVCALRTVHVKES